MSEIKGNRGRHHRIIVLRALIENGLPDNPAIGIVPLRLPDKPRGGDRMGIERLGLYRALWQFGAGKKTAARNVQHAFVKATIIVDQTQEIPQLQNRHQLITGQGIVTRERALTVDKVIGDAIHRESTPVM